MKKYAHMLRDGRQELGISQREAGRRLGLSGAYVAQLETGVRPPLSERQTLEAARLYGLNPLALLAAAVQEEWPAFIRLLAGIGQVPERAPRENSEEEYDG